MDMFVIEGGTPLSGRVTVGGSKNAALPLMAASLLAEGEHTLHNIPWLVDVHTMSALLQSLGAHVTSFAEGSIRIENRGSESCLADYDLVRRMRAGVCVLGPLLARRGKAYVSLPGGCAIGDRPIDLHLKGLRALGADVRVERGYVVAECRRLRGAPIFLGGPFGSTVTGTCNIMAAAALADGETTIESAACEPEVIDFGNYLNAMGACISGLGTPLIHIDGVDHLEPAEHTVIPDRIEAATLMLAVAITRGCIELKQVPVGHMTAVLEKLREIGVQTEPISSTDIGFPTLKITVPNRPHASDLTALPYPGVPTDLQAQFMALLTLADGISVVTDKVFPDRFLHAAELVRLGARIRREGPTALVSGVERLSGASVMASDLRASAALVLAGLAAERPTIVRRIYHLDRGYERLECKLNQLGAQVQRVGDEPAAATVIRPPQTSGTFQRPDAAHASASPPHTTVQHPTEDQAPVPDPLLP